MRVAIITANTDIYKGTKANESGEAVKLVAEEAGLEVVFMRALPLDREVLSTVMKRMTDGKTAERGRQCIGGATWSSHDSPIYA